MRDSTSQDPANARAPRSPDLGVYVHVPFCERVCPYCDFAVEAAGRLAPERAQEFVARVLEELALVRRTWPEALEGRRLATIYLGGGTPGLLPAREVERLLEALRGAFAGEPEEVTLELNPGGDEAGRAREFRAAGVSRLSVGLQSLQDPLLKGLGRAQSAREARSGLEACLAADFRSLSADLIYGAPGQSPEHLLGDVETLIDLGLPHVSAYALTIEPGTPFGRARAAGRLALPDEDAVVEMAQGLRARLTASGLEPYEISSLARAGHRSRHNQRYWLRQDVLGLGPSAAGLLGRVRSQNRRDRASWERALAAGQLPLAENDPLTPRQERQETLGLGLRRLAGVSRAAYWRSFGSVPEADFPDEIAELRGLGLIADRGGQLALTERGILFADDVFLRFVGN